MAKIRDLAEARSGETFYFNPEIIKEIEDFNPRNYESQEVKDHIEKIAKSIQENGVASLEPITISQIDGEVFVLRGHCRRRAALLARSWGVDFKGIRCLVDNLSDADRTMDLLNSNAGLSLTMLEKATVVKRLLNFGWSVEDIAKKHGVSVTAVNNMLVIHEAPEPIKELVKEGAVSATTAIETIQEKGTEAAVKVLEDAVENAQARGKTRATAKDLHPRIKKVTLPAEKKGLAIYNFKSKKSDNFSPDSDAGDMPCALCLNRKELFICENCKHFLEAEENGD